MGREQDYISVARDRVRAVWTNLHELREMQAQWNALAYGDPGNLPDGVGNNAGVTAAQVGSAVFDSTDALLATLEGNGGGHATNFARLL